MPALQEPSLGSHANLTALLDALTALKKGRRGVRLPLDWTGVAGKVADAFNDVVELNERMAGELGRLSRVVGKEGKLGQRLSLGDVDGFWEESVDSVNDLIDDLVHPTSETARVIGAVAQGDLSQTMALEVDDRPLQGEFLRTAKTINRMVDQLGSFAGGSDPRGPRSGHRRQARRPGRGEGRRRHVEGPHRHRQLHGRQPHRPGPQHRRRDHRRRQRRPVEEDHRRCEGRNSSS